MNKSNLKVVSIFVCVFVTLMSLVAFFVTPISRGISVDEEYVPSSEIVSLDVVATVDEYKKVNVKETFTMHFLTSGLTEVIRFFPYANFEYRDINGKVEERATYNKITNIDGRGENDEKLNVYLDEESGYITIGLKTNRYIPVDDYRNYTINYTYELAKDEVVGSDQLYFNIVGTNSLIDVSNVTFSITFPSISDVKDYKIYYGEEGSTKTLIPSLNNNTLSGAVEKLNPRSGITILASFEDGYFKNVSQFNYVGLIAIALALLALTLSIISFKFKQKDNYPKPVEVMAPDGITPLKADVLYSGSASTRSIPATIVYLASHGFLKIKEREDDEIVLIKQDKDTSILDENEKLIYEELFNKKDKINISDLKPSFVTKCETCKKKVTSDVNETLYDKKNRKKHMWIRIGVSAFAIATLVAVMFTINFKYGFLSNVFATIFMGLFANIILAIVIGFSVKNKLFIVPIAYTLAILIKHYYNVSSNLIALDPYLFGATSVLIAVVALVIMMGDSKYTSEGKILKGRTLGFKNFIEKCETNQIKMFVKENPSYFFDVLPYAYVFGLNKEWIDKLKELEIAQPEWLETSVWDYMIFNSLMNNMYRQSMKTYTQTLVKTSGGSFSGGGGFGGGFSGGGSGGGGFGAR